MKDTDIITLYNQRNERAIYETHQKYGDYCMSISLGILHNHQDAEECVNDTYLHTWKSIPPKQPSVLRTFLGKLTRNISIDRLRTRRRARRDSELTVSFEELSECIPSGQSPEQVLEMQELSRVIDRFLDTLDPDSRNMFLRRYWFFDSIAQIAAGFGVSQSKVKMRLFRVRNELKEYLAREADIYVG